MKKFLLFASLVLAMFIAKAQDPMFLKDDKLLNLGVGLRGYPVVSASLDYCITDGIADKGSIGVGPYAGLGLGLGNYYSKGAYITAGVRGTFHYPIIEDLDTYAGVGLGFRFAAYSYGGTSFHVAQGSGFFIGANYPLTETIIVFGELGSGVSYLTAGITIFL